MNEKALRDNFCSAVWSSLFIDEYGDVFPCCKRVVGVKPLCDENGISINVSQSNFLIRAWNSLDMRKMRRDFLAGIYPARCQQCYQDDKLGLISLRQNLNRKFGHKIYDVVENTNDEGVAPLNLFFLDIRFGNKCNLACRMCSPQFSKNLIKEFKILNPTEMYIREKENDWFCDIEKTIRRRDRACFEFRRNIGRGRRAIYYRRSFEFFEENECARCCQEDKTVFCDKSNHHFGRIA